MNGARAGRDALELADQKKAFPRWTVMPSDSVGYKKGGLSLASLVA